MFSEHTNDSEAWYKTGTLGGAILETPYLASQANLCFMQNSSCSTGN